MSLCESETEETINSLVKPEATRRWSPGGKEEMRITVGSRFTAKLAGPAALAMLLSLGAAAWAQEASSESVSDLRSEVRELQKEIHELKGQVNTIKSQEAIVPPPAADAKPMTLGEHVGSLGKDVEDIRTN